VSNTPGNLLEFCFYWNFASSLNLEQASEWAWDQTYKNDNNSQFMYSWYVTCKM